MSFLPVMGYISGMFLLGFLWWLCNGILEYMSPYSQTGTVFDLMNYFWTGLLVVYLIFGGWYMVKLYSEKYYTGGAF